MCAMVENLVSWETEAYGDRSIMERLLTMSCPTTGDSFTSYSYDTHISEVRYM
jgi:hypothetical protein